MSNSTLRRWSIDGSYVRALRPDEAVQLPVEETVDILTQRFGDSVRRALSPEQTSPQVSARNAPPELRGPQCDQPDGSWLKTSNMVGINIRTVGNVWHAVNYMLTLPKAVDSVHLLPFWEAGVVGSLYGISSWNLNRHFFSPELFEVYPHLHTVGHQLKAVVNLLHVMGRSVGMDVIPHTDRYSEIVLAFPNYFEWLKRVGLDIVDHREELHLDAQVAIFDLLTEIGPACEGMDLPENGQELFETLDEAQRLLVLFGKPEDGNGREERRNRFVRCLHGLGLEPVPGTMAPPYRGLQVDPDPQACSTDSFGMQWRDYLVTEPTSMSRVFGPLTRYKLYHRKNDNRDWEIDFGRPRPEVFDYVVSKYRAVQDIFGLDFMRGDMSHVQMRPDGVPGRVDQYYDLLSAVKHGIRRSVPHFGYFAESFLAPPGVMAYGAEEDHLEASDADTTLGDLQSTVIGDDDFMERLARYDAIASQNSFTPAFTVITSDKDDPRFDSFFEAGLELRFFLGLFLPHMPSYMSLGFQLRDVHLTPAPNEHYTKLYVFQETTGPKATTGPFVWGKNLMLFHRIQRIKQLCETLDYDLTVRGSGMRWLDAPDGTGSNCVIAWQLGAADGLLACANLGNRRIQLPDAVDRNGWEMVFSTTGARRQDRLGAYEGRLYSPARV